MTSGESARLMREHDIARPPIVGRDPRPLPKHVRQEGDIHQTGTGTPAGTVIPAGSMRSASVTFMSIVLAAALGAMDALDVGAVGGPTVGPHNDVGRRRRSKSWQRAYWPANDG